MFFRIGIHSPSKNSRRRVNSMQTVEHWLEWKKLCALGLCSEDTKNSLRAYAHQRFTLFLTTYAAKYKANQAPPTALECWHWFETYLLTRNNDEGKRYKDWIFSRYAGNSPPTLDTVQSGATLLMRDVVREYLRLEFTGLAPLTPGDDSISNIRDRPQLDELLADESDTALAAQRNEIKSIAVTKAPLIFSVLTHRERIALLAREQGLSLAHPMAVAAAKCGKSMLGKAHYTALVKIAEFARSSFPHEDRIFWAHFSIELLREIKTCIISWEKSEKPLCHSLLLIKEHGKRESNNE